MPEINEQINDRIADTEKHPTAEALFPQGYTVVQNNEDKPDTIVPHSTKKRTRTTKPAVGGKKTDTKTLIATLKEKLEIIEWIEETVVNMDITEIKSATPVSPKAREVLIQLQKSVETAKEVAIQSIQQI